MKKNRFTEEQIVAALRDAEATTVAASARKHGVSEQSIHRWRKQYDGMQVSDVRELKRLREENNRLKKLLAERDLEVEVMKEIQEKNGEPTHAASSGSVRDRARSQSPSSGMFMLDTALWYPLSFST